MDVVWGKDLDIEGETSVAVTTVKLPDSLLFLVFPYLVFGLIKSQYHTKITDHSIQWITSSRNKGLNSINNLVLVLKLYWRSWQCFELTKQKNFRFADSVRSFGWIARGKAPVVANDQFNGCRVKSWNYKTRAILSGIIVRWIISRWVALASLVTVESFLTFVLS